MKIAIQSGEEVIEDAQLAQVIHSYIHTYIHLYAVYTEYTCTSSKDRKDIDIC